MKVAVVGAGVLGRAVVRALAERGDRVTVLTPRPTELPALWRQCDAVSGNGLRKGIEGNDALVLAADLEEQGLRHVASAAAWAGVGRWVRAARPGEAKERENLARQGFSGLITLRLPLLFAEDDPVLGPWLAAVRRGRPLRVGGADLRLRPLAALDAVKALLRALDGKLERPLVELRGPEALTVGEAADKVQRRFKVERSWLPARLPRGELLRALAPAQLEGRDDWDELGLGSRLTLDSFLDRWARLHLE